MCAKKFQTTFVSKKYGELVGDITILPVVIWSKCDSTFK